LRNRLQEGLFRPGRRTRDIWLCRK